MCQRGEVYRLHLTQNLVHHTAKMWGVTQMGLTFQRTKTQGDTRMGLRHQEDLQPETHPLQEPHPSQEDEKAWQAWYGCRRPQGELRPNNLTGCSWAVPRTVDGTVGRDGETPIEHRLGGRPGEAPMFCPFDSGVGGGTWSCKDWGGVAEQFFLQMWLNHVRATTAVHPSWGFWGVLLQFLICGQKN